MDKPRTIPGRLADTLGLAGLQVAERCAVVTFAIAAYQAGRSLVSAGASPWAAIATAAVSAAYVALPRFRAMRGDPQAGFLPPEVLAAADRCEVRARLSRDDGMWVVTRHRTGEVSFMTERAFRAFASDLPEGTGIAVVERDAKGFHVRRYVAGCLESDAEAAWRTFSTDGTLVRAADYGGGEFRGERAIDVAAFVPGA